MSLFRREPEPQRNSAAAHWRGRRVNGAIFGALYVEHFNCAAISSNIASSSARGLSPIRSSFSTVMRPVLAVNFAGQAVATYRGFAKADHTPVESVSVGCS